MPSIQRVKNWYAQSFEVRYYLLFHTLIIHLYHRS